MVRSDKKPLVSVIMATYNEPVSYITAAIESICHQTYPYLELLVIDDSTKEETIKAINELAAKDSRIKVIRQKKRMGFVRALNIGLTQAKGSFIARIDGDDIACEDRIAKQVDYFRLHPKVDILGGAMNIIDEKGTVTAIRKYPQKGFRLHLWTIFRNPLGHPSVMMKSDIPRNGFLYDESMGHGCEDLEMWFLLRNYGFCIHNMQDILINYRIYTNMAQKRKRDKNQNIRARLKNFSFKYFIIDTSAIFFFAVRSLTPTRIVSWYYEKENAQRHR